MAADQSLIAAIQRIAMGAPELSEVTSLLREIKSRGGIKGTSWKIGGDGDSQELYPDCCTDQGGTSGGDPDVYGPDNPPPPIDEDAPPELPTTPDGWTDCTTGQPINFTPSGFPQAESCKECAPDEMWEEGTYWEGNFLTTARRATRSEAAGAVAERWAVQNRPPPRYTGLSVSYGGYVPITEGSETDFYFSVSATYYDTLAEENGSISRDAGPGGARVYRRTCSASDVTEGRYGCDLTEAPEECGDSWAEDGSTDYTLRNGCLVTSKCDPDAPTSSLGCNDCITICNDQGQERQICGTSDGGFIMTDPSGTYDGGKYDANGNRTEILPAGSTGGYI